MLIRCKTQQRTVVVGALVAYMGYLHKTTKLKMALTIMQAPAILPVMPRLKHSTPTNTKKVARVLGSYKKPKLLAMCLATRCQLNSKQQSRQEKALYIFGKGGRGRKGRKGVSTQNTGEGYGHSPTNRATHKT